MFFSVIFCILGIQKVHSESTDHLPNKLLLNQTRRILRGNEAGDTRPYMVYLRPAATDSTQAKPSSWLCGGVIIHAQYILTSAACIEDVNQFYVVSGTHRWLPLGEEDECIRNGAKKAIWKCVPKDYVFDGKDFDNIRWMINDMAVVKVEEEFNFEKRIRGCDFVPNLIAYNNQSESLEAPGTVASIAGWGSIDRFGDTFGRSTMNSPELLETDVILISKKKCQRQWPERYHHIIEKSMICAKDGVGADSMSERCKEQGINCKELVYSDEEEDDFHARRFMLEPNKSQIHPSAHNGTRRAKAVSGGFCENDHGGPLIYGDGADATVIGIISACLVKERTNKCYGPFLYTSVYKNRHLINCAIFKDHAGDCSKIFRTGDTHLEQEINWAGHPDGPAKNEIAKMRRTEEKMNKNGTLQLNNTKPRPIDKVVKHGGVILRSFDDHAEMKMIDANATV
nr:uncharacterized protein LOC117993438 isoform X3 [Maniola hyperantus]